jgi:RNA polymerase sigma factor (sigma-70 family)
MRSEDGYFVRKCLEGDPTAFGFLVDKYKACVYAFTYSRLHNFHDAEDLTQETFIKAYRNLHTLKRYDSFLAWIYAIASNLCKMHVRTQSRRPDKEHIEDQETEKLESPSMDSYRDDMVNKSLREALDSLPDIYQEVLTLYYFGGMDGKEIARFLGISHDNVKQRLVRARVQLKEEVITMMNATFQQERLQASFTFRIVEAIKHIKIHPMSTAKGVPWGISIAAGIIFTVLSLGSRIMVSQDIGIPISFSLPSELKVLNIGEIPVDVVKISKIPFILGQQNQEKGEKPKLSDPQLQNAAFLDPQGEGNTWTRKADMPTARWGLSTAVIDERIYAFGGCWIVMEEYNSETDTWIKKDFDEDPEITGFGVASSVSAVERVIFIIGGIKPDESAFLSTTLSYNPLTNKYKKKADMSTARCYLTTSVVNGKIYAIGGWNGTTLSTVEEYDQITDRWTKKTDMPTVRRALSSSVVNGKIYIIGGFGKNDEILSTVEEYDPATDTWTKES